MMKVAVVTTFFPNRSDPYRAIFIRHLVRAMADKAHVTVVSPIPLAPAWPRRAAWMALRAIPAEDECDGIHVVHPRYLVVPRLDALSGATFGLGVYHPLRALRERGAVDVVHVHCAYPDAVGTAAAAIRLSLPFVVTAHGSDINVYAQRRLVRSQLRWALARSNSVVAVSRPLQDRLLEFEPRLADRIAQIPCAGIDPEIFHPRHREAARASCGIALGARIVVFVGRLVPIKGIEVLLSAWQALENSSEITSADRLLLVGDGPLKAKLQGLASSPIGTVRFLGSLPQATIAEWLRAADCLCLPSYAEGLPNVVVEALACGTPVVASAVGGIPDLVTPGATGSLVPPGEVEPLARAIGAVLKCEWDRDRIADSVAGFTWPSLAARNLDVLAAARTPGRLWA
jgi:glycosyltransferase involved in cell wall biosynthesis